VTFIVLASFTAMSLLLFLGASLALNLAPGPDMLYVSTRSIAQGRRAGIISAFGIAAGSVVHTLLIASGLAALLHAVPIAYDIVRYAGAAYLIWLGVQALRHRPTAAMGPHLERANEWSIFRQGVITNLLNPKVAMFFLAFLPQFTDPAQGSLALQIVVLGSLFNLSGTIVNVAVACLAASARQFLQSVRFGGLFRWLTGSVFVGLGVRLALDAPNER
jgi:threonine/homoserine/homoserine lactone efflux protein